MDAQAPRPRTLSVGGAAYDLFVEIDAPMTVKKGNDVIEIPVGSKITIAGAHETCGGGAANTSTGLARLGLKAKFSGVVGADKWGERMLAQLNESGVDTSDATVVENEMTGFSVILLLPNGERTILHHAGVNSHLDDVTFARDAVADVDAVYLNRLSDEACEIQNDIAAFILAHPETHLTWNPGGCQIKDGMQATDAAALLKVTDLLLLNKEEALAFTGKTDVKSAMEALRDAGATTVCVTDGKNGAIGLDATGAYQIPCKEGVTVVDTTGAGDAFGSAATWALLTGNELPFALKAGTLNAASVVSAIGAQAGLLTDTEINLALREHDLPITRPW